MLGPEGRERAGKREHGPVAVGADEDDGQRGADARIADHAGHVDATAGQHLEHEIRGPIGADQPDERGSQAEPGRRVRHERAAPAQCQPRTRDFALRLAVREHLGRAAHDHIRVRVADDDEVVAGDHRLSPRRGGRRPSQPVR